MAVMESRCEASRRQKQNSARADLVSAAVASRVARVARASWTPDPRENTSASIVARSLTGQMYFTALGALEEIELGGPLGPGHLDRGREVHLAEMNAAGPLAVVSAR